MITKTLAITKKIKFPAIFVKVRDNGAEPQLTGNQYSVLSFASFFCHRGLRIPMAFFINIKIRIIYLISKYLMRIFCFFSSFFPERTREKNYSSRKGQNYRLPDQKRDSETLSRTFK